ncbi:TPA: site-specific DNA-methyltransferase [Candidatus Poribacteria bacterium]|nr:site-specific DNA-methyltransferase [Candidatus Poribacteria bacterium]
MDRGCGELKMSRNRKGTETSSFGVSKREAHDSTLFYSQRIYSELRSKIKKKVEYVENKIASNVIDKVHCLDSRDMSILPDSSVHLMATSPPYVAAKEYDKNWTLGEYLKLLKDVFTETYKKLVPGGRACINIANLGRTPYIPLHSYIIRDMLDIGYLMRGEVIWNKEASAGTSTAWGSWKSAKNPTLRDVHEYIMIFSKETFSRYNSDRNNTISKDEFLEFSKSIWCFPTESAKRVGHPAPFPVELPYRLIQLYTFKGDVVLDPFVGSGTTCVAAIKAGRHFVGFDNNEGYIKIARKRIENLLSQRKLLEFHTYT